jgi:hypothetical protein
MDYVLGCKWIHTWTHDKWKYKFHKMTDLSSPKWQLSSPTVRHIIENLQWLEKSGLVLFSITKKLLH